MNLLRTIISSLENKNYYLDMIILFLCYALPFVSKDFVSPLLRWIILDFELKHVFQKNPKFFQSILYRMDKWNLLFSRNMLLFDVLNMLIHHFVLFFNILSQKKKFSVQRKKQFSVKLHDFFPHILCRMDIYFKRLFIYQSGITMNMSNT